MKVRLEPIVRRQLRLTATHLVSDTRTFPMAWQLATRGIQQVSDTRPRLAQSVTYVSHSRVARTCECLVKVSAQLFLNVLAESLDEQEEKHKPS